MRVPKGLVTLAVGAVAGGFVAVTATAAGATGTGVRVPAKPTALVVTSANTALSVAWAAPVTDGGRPVTRYTATATLKGQPTETCTTSTTMSCVITGIVNPLGKAKNIYKVAVTATNSVGTGRAATSHATGTTAVDCAYVGEFGNLQGCDLSGVNLSPGGNLTGANLTGTDLAGADLAYVHMPDAILTDANLTGADLVGTVAQAADLSGADLSDVDLEGADLISAVLTSASLVDANLTNADLVGADLVRATLTGVIWSDTECPDGTNSNSDGKSCVNDLLTE